MLLSLINVLSLRSLNPSKRSLEHNQLERREREKQKQKNNERSLDTIE